MRGSFIRCMCLIFFWTHQAFTDAQPTFTPGAKFRVELPDLNVLPENGHLTPLSGHSPPTPTWVASGEGLTPPNDQARMTQKWKGVDADMKLRTKTGLVHGKMHKTSVNNENQIAPEDNTNDQTEMHPTNPTLKSFPTKHDSTSHLKRKGVYADTELRTKAGHVHGKNHKLLMNNEYQITPAGNTIEAAQSRQINKQPIKSWKLYTSSDQKEDAVGQTTITETQKNPNFRDWSFVKKNSVIEIDSDPQRQESKFQIEKLLSFLNKLKQVRTVKHKTDMEQKNLGFTPDTRKHFWIRREYAEGFFKAYRKESKICPFPPAEIITPYERRLRIQRIILDIVDEKIDLEKYTIFSQEIVNHLTLKLDRRMLQLLQSKAKVDPRLQVTTRIEAVKKLTKCAVFLNLVYLKLFKEDENGKTTVQHIKSFLTFIKDLWEDIEKGNKFICNNNNFGEKLHKVLTFESSEHHTSPSNARGIGWSIVELWVHEAAKFKPHVGLHFHPEMVEIINKIILYSNYDEFPSRILKEGEVEAI